MQQALPLFRGGAAGPQLFRELLQRGGGIRRVNVRRDLPHQDGAVAEILAGKAEPLQRLPVLQQQRRVLPAQLRRHRLEQGLAHGRLLGGLQPVKVHPLMGGVLVDEPDAAVFALTDDVGVEHLPGDAPGGLLRRLDGLLLRQVQRLLPGNGRHEGPRRLFRFLRSRRCRFPGRLRHGGGRLADGHLFHRPEGRPVGLLFLGAVSHPRHPARCLAVKGGPGRRRRAGLGPRRDSGLGVGRLRPLAEAPGVHGLEKVLPGIHRLPRRLGRRGGCAVPVQAVQHRVVHGVEHLPLPGKLHLGLGGVHVHVHRRHRQRDGQHAAGELPLHDLVAVALLQGRRQQLGLDEPAVDEKHLHGPGTPAQQRLGDKAGHRRLAAPALHRHQAPGKLPAQGRVNSGIQPAVAGGVEGLGAVLDELKGNIGMGQGQMLHEAADRRRFGAVLPHEF